MNNYNKLPTTEEYKDLIQLALEDDGLMLKNHDYFSRIRGQIRAMTDSKEEYKALRDDILGAYDNRKNGRGYLVRTSDTDNGRFEKTPSNEVKNVELQKDYFDINHDLPSGSLFSVGITKDFDKKEPSFFIDHLKEMDMRGIKYVWSLGKDGLMITKYNANSRDETPRNEKGEYDSNPRIVHAMQNQYDLYHDRRVKDTDYMNAIRENIGKPYGEFGAVEIGADYKFQTVTAKECIDELDSCLTDEGLYNQVNGERLFQFTYIRTGTNKKIDTWR